MSEHIQGASASRPGSREPSPTVSAASGFDPSRGLVRANREPPNRLPKGATSHDVYDQPEAAIDVLARATGMSPREARNGLQALVKAGYVIAPRLPTNAMLDAYIQSYGDISVRPSGIITGVAKAKKRWAAMALIGTKVALSYQSSAHAPWLRDSDGSGEAIETALAGSTEGDSAGPKDIAQDQRP